MHGAWQLRLLTCNHNAGAAAMGVNTLCHSYLARMLRLLQAHRAHLCAKKQI